MSTQIDTLRLDTLIRTSHERITSLVLEVAGEVAKEARGLVPVKSGELRDSIEASLAGQAEAWVEAKSDHAASVEFGTPPHEIRPRYKRALYWPDAEHPVNRVRHPGTAARPFLKPAVEKIRQRIAAGGLNSLFAKELLK